MSKSNDKFMSYLTTDDLPISTILINMSNHIHNPNYDYYCIVEGKTDECFYKNLSISPFKENKIAYMYNNFKNESDESMSQHHNSNQNIGVSGKSAVIYSFNRFLVKYPKNMKNSMFIVDHDYDGLPCTKYDISPEHKQYITVLPVYSFENFFLSRDNLSISLNKLGFTKEDATNIYNQIMSIKYETLDYYVCKHIITSKFSEKKYKSLLKIKSKYTERDLFSYDYTCKGLKNCECLRSEIKTMKTEIYKYSDLQQLYEVTKSSMIKDIDNRLIKGKVLFGILNDILNFHYKKRISPYSHNIYRRIVMSLKMDFSPVFADIQEINIKRK